MLQLKEQKWWPEPKVKADRLFLVLSAPHARCLRWDGLRTGREKSEIRMEMKRARRVERIAEERTERATCAPTYIASQPTSQLGSRMFRLGKNLVFFCHSLRWTDFHVSIYYCRGTPTQPIRIQNQINSFIDSGIVNCCPFLFLNV